MNAEQLHAVCKELRDEINSGNFLSLLQQLQQALDQSISQPQQAQFQQKVGNFKTQLTEKLTAIEQEERPVTKRQIIEEIERCRSLFGRFRDAW